MLYNVIKDTANLIQNKCSPDNILIINYLINCLCHDVINDLWSLYKVSII